MELETAALDNALAAPAESAPAPVTEPVAPESAPGEVVEPVAEEPSKAIKELIHVRKRAQTAEQQAAYWQGVAEGRGRPAAEPVAPVAAPAAQAPVRPVLDNFETFEEWENADRDYVVQRAKFELRQEFQQEIVQKEAIQVQKTFWQKVETLAESDPYVKDEIAAVGRMVSSVVAELVVKSESGIDLVHYLNKNPQEAARISQMPPYQAAMELGSIAATIKATPKPKPPRQVSAAPEPIPTVTPAAGAIVDEDNLPIDQWVARRNAEAKRR